MNNKIITLAIIFSTFFGCQNKENKNENNTAAQTAAEQMSAAVTNKSTGLVNPNLASKDELIAIDSFTDEIAEAIMANRPYLKIADLDLVLGEYFDAEQRRELYKVIFVKLNLNTAPEAEILMIPGVGNKMAHEFDEYRPYLKIEQFRREIGKYVDDAEVARYEQYVFVPVELNTATKEEILAIPGVGNRMLHEFEEYRPYQNMDQFRREIGKYVDDVELRRLERFVYLKD